MMLSLIAEGLSIGVLVALIVCGVVMLAFAIFGIVIKVRETSGKARRVKNVSNVVVTEKYYDFTHLTEEEKDLIRRHRDSK